MGFSTGAVTTQQTAAATTAGSKPVSSPPGLVVTIRGGKFRTIKCNFFMTQDRSPHQTILTTAVPYTMKRTMGRIRQLSTATENMKSQPKQTQ